MKKRQKFYVASGIAPNGVRYFIRPNAGPKDTLDSTLRMGAIFSTKREATAAAKTFAAHHPATVKGWQAGPFVHEVNAKESRVGRQVWPRPDVIELIGGIE